MRSRNRTTTTTTSTPPTAFNDGNGTINNNVRYASVASSKRGIGSGPCTKCTCFHPATISAVAMISSFLTMQIVVDSFLVTVASMLTICTSLLVLLQQRKLRKLRSLRQEHNDLRRRASYLHGERERLHRTLDRLDTNVAALHYVPQELHKLAQSTRNVDVDRLVDIIHEQRAVNEKLRNKLQQRVTEPLLSIVLQADRGNKFSLSANEIDVLLMRLRHVKGIEVNEQRVRAMLNKDPSIHSVLSMLRSMKEQDDEYQYADPVFVIRLDTIITTRRTDKGGAVDSAVDAGGGGGNSNSPVDRKTTASF